MKEFMARWLQAASDDAQLQRLGRLCNLSLCIEVDSRQWFLEIQAGRAVSMQAGPFHLRSSDLQLRGALSAWQQFFRPVPPPGFHDLLAMSSYHHLHISGNQDLLREHLAFIKVLFALPRSFAAEHLLAAEAET